MPHISNEMLAQILGLMAMGVSIFGYLQKTDENTKKVFLLSSFVWIIHFYVMGIYSAMITSIIGIFRIFLSLKYKKNKRVFLGVISATLVAGIMTFENHFHLLPIIGSCISAYGYFFFEKVRLRAFMLVSSLFRLTFDLKISSIGGIINEIIIQTILIITMFKMIREEGKRVYIVEKVMSILHRRRSILDFGRFIAINDYIHTVRKFLKSKYQILKLQIIKICKKIINIFRKKREG